MKNDANIRIFHGKSRKIREKSRKMQGKSRNFRGIHSLMRQNRREILRSFPVIFGRFRSHFRSFPVIFRLIPIDSGKSFLFFPFYSFSSSNHPDFML